MEYRVEMSAEKILESPPRVQIKVLDSLLGFAVSIHHLPHLFHFFHFFTFLLKTLQGWTPSNQSLGSLPFFFKRPVHLYKLTPLKQ